MPLLRSLKGLVTGFSIDMALLAELTRRFIGTMNHPNGL